MSGKSMRDPVPAGGGQGLVRRFLEIRAVTRRIADPLSPEDCAAQSMTEASPIRWHLAHTTWFFETFVLARAIEEYRPFHPRYDFLFNSYYDAIGERVPQAMRGRMTRPDLGEILDYREHVDGRVADLLARGKDVAGDAASAVEVGLHHEQQHQELMLTDVKHLLSLNPLIPAYRELPVLPGRQAAPMRFLRYEGGLHSIGHTGEGFAFDNEGPRHRVFTHPFDVASRPVTNGEYLAFVEGGGYERPGPWLSDGWDWIVAEGVRAPLYWMREGGRWRVFTLSGLRDLDPAEPVSHLSYYEADAYARSVGARLPREAEWELVAEDLDVDGNFVEEGLLHPRPTEDQGWDAPAALYGDVWEWTMSPYLAYPGFRPAAGAIGEYNGKFMSNRLVLRGGSCVSPRTHLRPTYRNFFGPTARWQFSGFRLARDAS